MPMMNRIEGATHNADTQLARGVTHRRRLYCSSALLLLTVTASGVHADAPILPRTRRSKPRATPARASVIGIALTGIKRLITSYRAILDF